MLKNRLRVPIRLFCLIATFLALTLPSYGYGTYYLHTEDSGSANKEELKFDADGNHFTLSLNSLKGKWTIYKVNDGEWDPYNADYAIPNNGEYGQLHKNNYSFYCGNSSDVTIYNVKMSFYEWDSDHNPHTLQISYNLTEQTEQYPTLKYTGGKDNWEVVTLTDWNDSNHTFTYTTTLKNDQEFGFLDMYSTFYACLSSQNNEISKDCTRTLSSSNKKNFKWTGNEAEVTMIITMGDKNYATPQSVKFEVISQSDQPSTQVKYWDTEKPYYVDLSAAKSMFTNGQKLTIWDRIANITATASDPDNWIYCFTVTNRNYSGVLYIKK